MYSSSSQLLKQDCLNDRKNLLVSVTKMELIGRLKRTIVGHSPAFLELHQTIMEKYDNSSCHLPESQVELERAGQVQCSAPGGR